MNPYEQYMQELAQQMRAELTENGFESLETSEDVSNYMKNVNEEDTTFVVINSTCEVCLCWLARPAAVAVAEQNDKNQQIKSLYFFGQDKESNSNDARVHSTSSIKSILRFI